MPPEKSIKQWRKAGLCRIACHWRELWLLLLIILEIMCWHPTTSFVKNLLSSPPIIDRQDLWRRSPLNSASYANYTLMLTRTLEVPTPSYVQILQQGSLSITSFSLLRRGSVMQFDLNGVRRPKTWEGDYLWPNELSEYTDKTGTKVMLVADGFLMPGQNDGAIYAIRDPDSPSATSIRVTKHKKGWFYHRAMHVVLPGGTEGILTARAQKSVLGSGSGELVWLNMPVEFQSQSTSSNNGQSNSKTTTTLSTAATEEGGVEVEDAGCAEWEETVLATGPDVMFELMDMDVSDNQVEIVSAHFFGKKISIHSIRAVEGGGYPHVEVVEQNSMDTVGRPYGLCLATLTAGDKSSGGGVRGHNSRCIDSSSSSSSSSSGRCVDFRPQQLGSSRNYNYCFNSNTAASISSASASSVPVIDGSAAAAGVGSGSSSSTMHSFEYGLDSWLDYSRKRKFKSVNKVNKAKRKKSISAVRSRRAKYTERQFGDNQAVCDNSAPTHLLVTTHECSYDLPSAINMARGAIGGNYPIVKTFPQWMKRQDGALLEQQSSQQQDSIALSSSTDGIESERFASVSAGAPAVAAAFTSDIILNGRNAVDGSLQEDSETIGGSLFAYAIPSKKHIIPSTKESAEESRLGLPQQQQQQRQPQQQQEIGSAAGSTAEQSNSEVFAVSSASAAAASRAQLSNNDGAVFNNDVYHEVDTLQHHKALAAAITTTTAATRATAPFVSTTFAATVGVRNTEQDILQQQQPPPHERLNHHTNQQRQLRQQYQQEYQQQQLQQQLQTASVIPTVPTPAGEKVDTIKSLQDALDITTWERHTLCSGFKVRGWGGIFAPGAPGFPYVFHMPNRPQSPPLILLAGDCTGSAYVFAPVLPSSSSSSTTALETATVASASSAAVDTATATAPTAEISSSDGKCHGVRSSRISGLEAEQLIQNGVPVPVRAATPSTDPKGSSTDIRKLDNSSSSRYSNSVNSSNTNESKEYEGSREPSIPDYELVFEIECGATVGSAAVSSTNDGTGDVNLYIPAYELNKVHVFRLSERDLYPPEAL